MHLKKWLDVGFKLEDFVIGTSETFWKNNTLVRPNALQTTSRHTCLFSISLSLSLNFRN
jgi:hypothetical protein